MTKEKLTFDNIKKDLNLKARYQLAVIEDWRINYIIFTVLIATYVGLLFRNVWVGLLVSLFGVYHLVRYIMANKEHKIEMKAISSAMERSNISISVQKLSHIAKETIYEPHMTPRRMETHKTVTLFYFKAGSSWRAPNVMNYKWSKQYHMSRYGLENCSISGDEFYYVTLQGYNEIAYIYPCRFFELDSSLSPTE